MKKKVIYFHIGHLKTGTTAIQLYLNNNRAQLQKFGFYVPRTGLFNNAHHLLPVSLIKKYTSFNTPGHPPPDLVPHPDSLYRDLVNELRECRSDNIIISSEAFIDIFHEGVYNEKGEEGINLILRDFFGYLKDFQINLIIYLRDPFEYILSLYNEDVKGGYRDLNFITFLQNYLNKTFKYSPHFSFSIIFSYLLKYVKKEDIIIREYNKDVNIITDFCQVLNMPILENSSIKANPSLDTYELYLKLIFNISKIIWERTWNNKLVNFSHSISEIFIEFKKLKDFDKDHINMLVEKLKNHFYEEENRLAELVNFTFQKPFNERFEAFKERMQKMQDVNFDLREKDVFLIHLLTGLLLKDKKI